MPLDVIDMIPDPRNGGRYVRPEDLNKPTARPVDRGQDRSVAAEVKRTVPVGKVDWAVFGKAAESNPELKEHLGEIMATVDTVLFNFFGEQQKVLKGSMPVEELAAKMRAAEDRRIFKRIGSAPFLDWRELPLEEMLGGKAPEPERGLAVARTDVRTAPHEPVLASPWDEVEARPLGLLTEEAARLGMRENVVYGQFDGRPIEQVTVDGRQTCILAVMQEMMTHAGWIDVKKHPDFNFREQKGKMIEIAEQLEVLAADKSGTIITSMQKMKRMMGHMKEQLMQSKLAKPYEEMSPISVLGFSDVERMASMMSGQPEGRYNAQESALVYYMNLVAGEGENAVMGFTRGDLRNPTNGHEQLITGAAVVEGVVRFRILDSLQRKVVWASAEDLKRSMIAPMIVAYSHEKMTGPTELAEHEINRIAGRKTGVGGRQEG